MNDPLLEHLCLFTSNSLLHQKVFFFLPRERKPTFHQFAGGDPFAGGGGVECDSGCSTPFVSAPSSPRRGDGHYHHAACFFSAPASPTRGGGGGGVGSSGGPGCLVDFDFSSRFPSPSAATMSSADELFCNGQIRPVRLAAALLQPRQPAAPLVLDTEADDFQDEAVAEGEGGAEAAVDARGRVRSRSVRRKARSLSPFRSHWRRSPSPAPPQTSEPAPAVPPASRSSSASSTTSNASSSSSSSFARGSRRWGFIKDLLNRSKSDGGKSHSHHQQHSRNPTAALPPPSPGPSPSNKEAAATPKRRSPSPSPAKPGGAKRGAAAAAPGGRWRSAHERLYEARRAEAEEMRRRTCLPYRQGVLLFGCIGLGSRGYGAVHGLARGLNAAVSSRS